MQQGGGMGRKQTEAMEELAAGLRLLARLCCDHAVALQLVQLEWPASATALPQGLEEREGGAPRDVLTLARRGLSILLQHAPDALDELGACLYTLNTQHRHITILQDCIVHFTGE